jgi:hypothetical protein
MKLKTFSAQCTQKQRALTLSCDDCNLVSGGLAFFFSSVGINELKIKTKSEQLAQKTPPYRNQLPKFYQHENNTYIKDTYL